MIVCSILMKILVISYFRVMKWNVLSIDLNNINLGDGNYNEDNSEIVIHVRFFAWHITFEKRKALLKKS